MKPIFLYIDDLATLIGIVSNFILILAVKKRTAPNFKSFGSMVMNSAILNLLYAIVIMLCHHHLQFVDGVMLVNSYALDPYLSLWPKLILGSLEHFCVLEAIIILPVQYYYRYYLMNRSNQQSDHVFFILVSITLLCSSGMAVLAIWANFSAISRGSQHYIAMLDKSIIYGDPADSYVSAVDMKDLGAFVYIGWAGFVINTCYIGAIYYCYKSIHQVAPSNGMQLSKKAAKMRRQFTINLIVSTLNSWIFAMFPMLVIAITMFFKLEFGKLNFLFMSVMAWAPASNGIFSLVIIRPYRQFVFRSAASSVAQNKTIGTVSRTVPSTHKLSDEFPAKN